MRHEDFIQVIRTAAVNRLTSDESRTRLIGCKLVYGLGDGSYRGITYYSAWRNHVHLPYAKLTGNGLPWLPGFESPIDPPCDDFCEVAATGEESPIQLAGTTVHELAHVLTGACHGHDKTWKDSCAILGLNNAVAAGQHYRLEDFSEDLRTIIFNTTFPNDGKPNFHRSISGVNPAIAIAPKIKPCSLGIGVRGGKSRGVGSGSRLRLFTCDCGIKVRVARDEFNATCNECNSAFKRA